MDLNQLYFEHQVLLIRSARTLSCETRREQEFGASQIAQRIGSVQRHLGASAATSWEALADGDGFATALRAPCLPGARL